MSQFPRGNSIFFKLHSIYFCVKENITREVLLQRTLNDGIYKFDLILTQNGQPRHVLSTRIQIPTIAINNPSTFVAIISNFSLWCQD